MARTDEVSPVFKTGDKTYQSPRVDPTTHSLQFIDFAHCILHNGDHYYVKDWVDLTNGQVLDFLFVTPDTTKWAHLLISFGFEAEANISVYESATTSNNGTPITVFNRNRNSANTNTSLVYSAPTVTGTGTLIARYKAGSSRSVGGDIRAEGELVMKQNTKYLVRITNDTVTNNWCGYLADWYEYVNKTA